MISVLNTGIANASSVLYAIERCGYSATLTDDPDQLIQSSRVILPGVGTATALFERLQARELVECLRSLTQPVLGICLGMQALYQFSEEGNIPCLGVFPGTVSRLKPQDRQPVPHMGWNQVRSLRTSALLKGIPEDSYFYFVHSFRAPIQSETVAITNYGEKIPAIIETDEASKTGCWFGTQFHPERSGVWGEKLIKNFLNL